MIGKFARSHKASRELKIRSGKKLIFPATTRWNSLQLAYQRVVEIGQDINDVCFSNEFPSIVRKDFEMLQDVLKILTPVKLYTDKIQQDKVPTLPILLPGIECLIAKLRGLQVNLFIKKINLFLIIRMNLSPSLFPRFARN